MASDYLRSGCGATLAASIVLSGCGGLQSTMPTEPMMNGARVARSPGDLVYIARTERAHTGYRGVLTVLAFPSGKPFGTIRLDGFANGACSDASGDVWVVVGKPNRVYDAYEFAHGQSKPIAEIHVVHPHGIAGDCGVDPSTGNLAVVVGAVNCGICQAAVDIWKGARSGKPEIISIPFTPVGCAYDDSGNLFVDGSLGSTVFFDFAELANGSRGFQYVTLDKEPGGYPGGVRWDGSYVDIAGDNPRSGPELYRVDVSQYKGHVAGLVHLKGLFYGAAFDPYGNSVVASRGSKGRNVAIWPYPAGGKPAKELGRFPYAPRGLAISAAPAR